MFYRIFDSCLYHGLLFFFATFWGSKILLLVSGVYRIIHLFNHQYDLTDERNLLSQLSALLDAIEAGESPAHAFTRLEIQKYPTYFIHPEQTNFTFKVFKRQFDLYQKRVLLKEELKGNFMIVVFRMNVMKYLPIVLMMLLMFLQSQQIPVIAEVIMVSTFIFSFYYSDKIFKEYL